MGESLEARIRNYYLWLKMSKSLRVLQVGVFAALVALSAVCLVDRLVYIGFSWAALCMFAAGLVALVTLVFFVAVPLGLGQVCYTIDRNAGLKNLVSSGLGVAAADDEIARLVVARADEALAGRAPSTVIPLRTHWTGRFSFIPALALVAVFFMPQFDFAGRKEQAEKQLVEKAEVQRSAAKLTAKLTSIQAKSEVLQSIEQKEVSKDFNALAEDLKALGKKEALLKVGEFENKHREQFADQKRFEQVAKSLHESPEVAKLPPNTRDQVRKMTEGMNKGDFKQAGEALRELAKQLNGKELTADQKKDLARELSKLADQMGKQGDGTKLGEALRELESSTAQNLDDLLKQCQSAADGLEDLAKMCDDADAMRAMKEGLSDAKKEMLGDSFSDFDAREVEKYMEKQASLGAGQCQCGGGCADGMCPGNGVGDGTGGQGQGRGGNPLENMTDTSFKPEMSDSKLNKGAVLQQLFVSGVPDKGEALVEYSDVVQAAKQDAASSLARDQIPREYEELVKGYFDSLETGKNDKTGD